MHTLTAYQELSALPGSRRGLVVRAVRAVDGVTVVLKTAAPDQAARLQREAGLLRVAQGPGLVTLHTTHASPITLELEDLGDHTLYTLLREGPMVLDRALEFSLRLCQAIAGLHERGVWHLNLCPKNIALSPDGWPTLLDLGSAMRTTEHSPPRPREGEDARWCAPEQTGRSAREVDQRSDLYALGELLWMTLVGEHPFPHERSMGQQPPRLRAHLPMAPLALETLLMRLMDAQPEARPESARALQSALIQVRAMPRSPRITTLYGQEVAQAQAARALNEADRGGFALLTIEGPAGSGKSALVESLSRLPGVRRGLSAVGRGSAFHGYGPYRAWVQALRGALSQLQRRSHREQEAARERLQLALGHEGGMLRGLLPELEAFVGPQPQGRPQAPSDIERVLDRLVRGLMGALGQPGAPLLLFLDDAHDLDPASLRLLEALCQPPAFSGLLLVMAWRPEALSESHPLHHTLLTMRTLTPRHVQMEPLGAPELLRLCSDSLGLPEGGARALAQLLLESSAGNPARVQRGLEHLYRKGVLRYEATQGAWTWDLAATAELRLGLEPERLIKELLASLAPGCQSLLVTAAALGQEGLLSDLQSLHSLTQSQVLERLEPALEAGLLRCDKQHAWRFSDAELREAAQHLASAPDLRSMHRKIARLHLGSGEDRRFFMAVDHLNMGAGPEESASGRESRTHLNIEAARRAKLGSAFDASLAYTTQALAAAPDSWDRRSRLALHQDAARTAHLIGDQTRAGQLLSRAAMHARSPLEQASLVEIQVATLMASGQPQLAKERVLAGLALFDLSPQSSLRPPPPPQLERLLSMEPKRGLLSTERNALLARALQVGIRSAPELARWAAATLSRQALEEGPTAHTAMAVAWIAVCLSHGQGANPTPRPLLAMRLAKTALALLERVDSDPWETSVHAITAHRLYAQVEPPRLVLERIERAHSLSQRYSLRHCEARLGVHRAWLALRAGMPLASVEGRCVADLQLARRARNRGAMDRLVLMRQLCRALQGKTRPGRLDDESFDTAGLLASEHTDPETRAMVDAATLWLAVLEDDALSARIRADSASEAWEWLGSSSATPLIRTLRGIARLMGSPSPESLSSARRDQAWLDTTGFKAHATLLRAELLRVSGEQLQAISVFDQALQEAELSGPACATLCAARAASFHARAGRERIASSYGETLTQLRSRWGGPPGQLSPTADLGGALRTADAIASEVDLERLLERLLAVCVETAGADRGVLVLENPSGPILRAAGRPGDIVLEEQELSESSQVSLPAVAQVRASGHRFSTQDSSICPELADDPWISQTGVRSVLALPIRQQGRQLGVLVLENHLPHAFPPARVSLLELLVVQIASALDQTTLITRLRAALATQEATLEAQRATDQRYRDLFEGAPDPILLTDADGYVSDANEAAERWLAPQELVGARLSTLLGQDSVLDQANRQLRERRQVKSMRLKLPGGGSVSVSATWLWSEDTGPGTTQWVFRDVQELVDAAKELESRVLERTEQLSRSNSELEASNAELRQFATLASHDLKSPIRTVSSYLSLIRRRHMEELPAPVAAYLDKALASSVRMQALIDDLLSFSQVGQDRRPFAHVDLGQALTEALENLNSDVQASGAEVISQGLPTVLGNPIRLVQLLQNLLSNAIKYRQQGVCPLIHISATQSAGMVQIAIADNGIGIDPDSDRVVFDIFKRLHSRKAYSGNGIGLAICRKIVEMHGGAIWVQGQPGQGTTFKFSLPAATLPEQAAPPD